MTSRPPLRTPAGYTTTSPAPHPIPSLPMLRFVRAFGLNNAEQRRTMCRVSAQCMAVNHDIRSESSRRCNKLCSAATWHRRGKDFPIKH